MLQTDFEEPNTNKEDGQAALLLTRQPWEWPESNALLAFLLFVCSFVFLVGL